MIFQINQLVQLDNTSFVYAYSFNMFQVLNQSCMSENLEI